MGVETAGDKKSVKKKREDTEAASSSRRLPASPVSSPASVLCFLTPVSLRPPFLGKTLVVPPVPSLQMVQDKLHIS